MAFNLLRQVFKVSLSKSINPLNVYKTPYFIKVRLYGKLSRKTNEDRNQGSAGDTLQTKLIKHLGISNLDDFNLEKPKIKYSEFFPVSAPETFQENVSKVTVEDLPTLIYFIYNFKTRAHFGDVDAAINYVDRACCNKLKDMQPKDVFNNLYAFMYLIPNRILFLNFYEQAMFKLQKQLHTLSCRHLVQFCYYSGLAKKNNPELTQVLKSAITNIATNHLSELSEQDLCIVVNAAFKSSLKLQSTELLEKVAITLIDNLHNNKVDMSYFITLLKTLRQNRQENDELLASISKHILDLRGSDLQATSVGHILAYYADCLYRDNDVLELMSKIAVNDIINSQVGEASEYFTKNVRAKDISRFLWAVSYLNWSLKTEDLLKIEENIIERYVNNEFAKTPEDMFEILLSFWMLNYKPKHLLPIALSEKNLQVRFNKMRVDSRKNLLLTCITIESPEILKKFPHIEKHLHPFDYNEKTFTPVLHNRLSLQYVYKVLQSNTEALDIREVKYECQVPFLVVTGISIKFGENNNLVYIEVLDEGVCLRNYKDVPHGLMQLKLRLLEKMATPVIILKSKDVNDIKEESELVYYIKNKLEECLKK